MATKKTQQAQVPKVHIENTHIAVDSTTNEHTRAAVEAIALAAKANAEAIKAIADALKPSNAPVYGMYIGGD